MTEDCIICGKTCPPDRVTCSDGCHEEFVQKIEKEFGTHKKVTDALTGFSYKVPTRHILEKGLKWRDLAMRFPTWEDPGD